MSLAEKTYELKIEFRGHASKTPIQVKEDVRNWLIGLGEETFVEGVIDGLYMDCDLEEPDRDYYAELGGNAVPISLYKYDRPYLQSLKQNLEKVFGSMVECHEYDMDTKVWLEGWKESFKPIATRRFYVYPPWDKNPIPSGLLPVEIEPGMAFGTGQHATTQLCLRQLENFFEAYPKSHPRHVSDLSILDVGTGTGILAIAAAKEKVRRVDGTDIDVDAVRAAGENARVNGVSLELFQGSFPPASQVPKGGYDLVIANILTPILKKLMKDLSRHVMVGGGLMLSGLLVEDEEEIIAAADLENLKLSNRDRLEDWSCLIFEKKS